jgi:two-component system, NarL family, sensor histidine kinase DegS
MPTEEINENIVNALRTEVEGAIGETVERLRRIEASAQARLRQVTQEQEHLQTIVTELHYRLERYITSPLPPRNITGPLTPDQLTAMQEQEEAMQKRGGTLERVSNELEQVSTRLSWLIHQIEGACDWVLASPDGDGEGDTHRETRGTANEQVMWAQIVMGQEAERARLAREVHDGPAQALSNAVLRLQLVEQMYKYRPEEVQPELTRMKGALQASLNDVRRFMFNLRPASLSEIGLLPTLRQYVRDYSEQYDVPVDLEIPDSLPLSANQELVVFRVIQEALQNIHKHAEATQIAVRIGQKGNNYVVSITDNGKGFDLRSARNRRPSSSGLVSMRERAATVGGTLKVESKVSSGTTISMTLPGPKG